MDTIVANDTVQAHITNPPSLSPHPNFFNILKLQSHFAKAIRKISCPQSVVKGWAGAVMLPGMYILIDPTTFHLNIASATTTPVYPIKTNPDCDVAPYTREEVVAEQLLMVNLSYLIMVE
jgi:hypothetical protein